MSSSVLEILGPDGPVAKRLSGYESRSEQLAMAEVVAAAIDGKKNLMVEAGTGVGKSFAYLVPALLAATNTKDRKRIIISTNTISLQEQLIQKDIPFLRSIWEGEFSAVLVKGRTNYLSRRRKNVAVGRAGATLFEEQAHLELQSIDLWSEETTDGSRSDLSFRPLPIVWDQVQSESGNCLGKSCPEYKDCFYFAARRRVWNANLLVVNHSLFFSDLALRQLNTSILPDYQVVIFDEAHNLEDAAAKHMGIEVSSAAVEYQLNKLYNERSQKGLLIYHRFDDLRQDSQQVRYEARDFFEDLAAWRHSFGGKNGRVRSKRIVVNRISEPLRALGRKIGENAEQIQEDTERIELTALANRCQDLGRAVASWLEQEESQNVYWIETSSRGRVTLVSSPIEIGAMLRTQLWSQAPSAILTSATLKTGSSDGFAYFRNRLGLEGCEESALGSPFDYRKQVRLQVSKDLPDPSVDHVAFEEATLRLIPHYVSQTDGHAFVLFTSHRAMKEAAERLGGWFASHHYPLFSQSDGMPRSKMLEEFRNTPRSVLFGTDSFWQGVDVRGDKLQCVIITRLPFSVPDHPLTQARLEAIRRRGGNPFREFSLPGAILKLKQGFGRLIRTRTDKGQVVILDPRVITKPYGKMFLDALPECGEEL